MKEALDKLNKVFENKVRLGIMSMLMVDPWVHYSTLKKTLAVSDGNLATHLKVMRQKEYIREKKEFINRKPHTTYQATQTGKDAFTDHLNALEAIIQGVQEEE